MSEWYFFQKCSQSFLDYFVDFVWRNIPGIEAFFLVDNLGKIKFRKVSNYFDEKNFQFIDEFISNISSQFDGVNSKNSQNNLKMIVNIFEKNTILTYPINENNIMLIAVPNDTNYSDSVRFVSSLHQKS